MEMLREHFRPEFLNRVDDIVIFRPLGEEQLAQIVDLRLEDLKKLLADRQDHARADGRGTQLLLAAGYDQAYGARPLKRAIQRMIQDPLAMKILDGEVLHGDHVRIEGDRKAGVLRFEVTSRAGIPLEHGVAIGKA